MHFILMMISFSFSTAMVPAGDGVYRTVYRGPSQRSRNAKNVPFSKQNHNMQGLFESSQAGGTYHTNESVTYCHPAELVRYRCSRSYTFKIRLLLFFIYSNFKLKKNVF